MVDPAPHDQPKKKGRVESAVKYVTQNFFRAQEELNVEALAPKLAIWVRDVAGARRAVRIHMLASHEEDMSNRAVQPSKLGGVLAILIGISVAVGGIVASVSKAGSRHELELLRDSGQRVRGQVIATRYERESHYRRATDHYWLTVRFVHAAAQVVQDVEIHTRFVDSLFHGR